MADPVNCDFPDSEWDPDLLEVADSPTPQLLPNWRSAVWLPPVPFNRLPQECQYMIALKAERHEKETVINEQARGDVYQATDSIQRVVGVIDETHRATRAARRMLYDNLDPTVFYFKRLYRRARAFMCCADIEPMFPKGTDLYPAHASYPSGHASQAHALAYFYAWLFPHLTDSLMSAAADIARNREVAGLHYPSDSLAGKVLAAQVVDQLFLSKDFSALAKAAKAEWR